MEINNLTESISQDTIYMAFVKLAQKKCFNDDFWGINISISKREDAFENGEQEGTRGSKTWETLIKRSGDR